MLRSASKHFTPIVGGVDETVGGEPDLAVIAAAFADSRRIRILLALADGRALPAGRLAQEAGIAAPTASSHLAQLLNINLLTVEQHGRRRYYRLASAHVEGVLEALARLAPQRPINSLREHTRAHALRAARTCYGHLAGQLGVRIFHGMIARGWVTGSDGMHHPGRDDDRPSSPGRVHVYCLTDSGATELARWGLPAQLLDTSTWLRYCVDWTEQAHHLAGPHGSALAKHLLENDWIARGKVPRSIVVTSAGHRHLDGLIVPLAKQTQR
jgi:DNA-binding transcriptional ArsR family regulator